MTALRRLVRPSTFAGFGAAWALTVASLLPLPVAGGMLTAAVLIPGVLTMWAARTGTAAGPRFRALLLGGGLVLTGVTGAGGAVITLAGPPADIDGVPPAARLYLVALVLVALVTLPALLRPQQHRDPMGRLRVCLDIVGVSACLVLPPWVLIFSDGYQRGASAIATVVGTTATAVAAVVGVHAIRHRASLRWAGPGLALALICLAALAIGADNPANPNSAVAAVAAGAAVNIAAWVMWWASVRVDPQAGPPVPAGSEPAAGFPLFALPVLGSSVAVAARLLDGGDLDATAIALAVIALLAVATREFVAAIALRRHADLLTHHGERLRSLMFGASDVAMVLDTGLAVCWQSPAAARHFGLSDQEVLGRPITSLVHREQAAALGAFLTARLNEDRTDLIDERPVAARLRDGFGRWRETEWTVGGADPAMPGRSLVLHIRDVTDRRELEQALQQASHLDPLTGLANLRGLRRAGPRTTDGSALIVLELSGLTAIADVHGTERSEAVLVEAARRVRTRIDTFEVCARVGDTRLAVLTRSGAVSAHLLANQLVTALTAPYELDGAGAHLLVWAGLTDACPQTDIDEALRRAALGLRVARSQPPGGVEWYDEAIEEQLVRRSALEQDLPTALDRNEVELLFQPVFELPGRRPVGVEAVLSWRHPALGRLAADELLALAEDLGMLGELRRWGFHRTCRQVAAWRQEYQPLWFSIGVRPSELGEETFRAGLDELLTAHRIPRSALVVEVSEDDLHQSPEASERLAEHLRRLRMSDVRTAVGHFGAGPTSLSRLRVLPVDLLKIDRAVFSPQESAPAAVGAIMDIAVTLGRRLGMEVIADGLTTDDDVETVHSTGCRLGQGDLLARPMPAEHVEALLERSREADRPYFG
ncbi:EAL domain-containing protein [Actinoplanes sp. NPDC023801]|uniref:EAL domain-containing protein n=1 Tax=Actinoplanes sp. NPDC023801 TaxID=3154595 RepID=UPI0033F6CD10